MVDMLGAAPTDLLRAASALQSDTIALRRAIHEDPEIGLDTPRTVEKVKAALAGLPLAITEAQSCTGFIAVLEGARPGRTVLLRGDMDALPMPEDAPVDFRSRIPNAMHACGHDAHTAMLASAARVLSARRDRIEGRVMLMFQPGEEGYQGARFMLEEGLLDAPKPDAAFAIHISPNIPAGMIGTRAGPLLASANEFEIVVRGRGGHASMPHQAIDPTLVACEIALALQTFVTRRVNAFDPAVVTVASISGGTTFNVIPESVRLLGTFRAVSDATFKLVHDGIRRIADNIARAHECEAVVDIRDGFPVTINDPRAAALVEAAVHAELGPNAFIPMPTPAMGSEDFSYVLQRTPGAMYFLGVCPEGQNFQSACPCHSNKMELNEGAMAAGVALHCAVAERFLAHGFAD